MGGKHREQTSGNAQGKAAADGDSEAAQNYGNALKVDGAAGSVETCPRGQGPSEDTLQRVLPVFLDLVTPAAVWLCYHVCKGWMQVLEGRGMCRRTTQLCSTLAQDGTHATLAQNALQRLRGSNPGAPTRALCLDSNSFLQRSCERLQRVSGWKGGLLDWLQAASQEPDASFLSRGAASTAQALGLSLVQWVGKPEGRYPCFCTMKGHSGFVHSAAFSPDGKRVVSGSKDKLVIIWDAETGTKVSSFVGVR